MGNGSTTLFAVPFLFLENNDLEVVLSSPDTETVQTISTDYQLSGAGHHTGGICTMTSAPAKGEHLVIRRNPSIVQEVDYVENDAFPAATHEAALDKLTMICQTLSERLDRTITFRVSSAVSGVELPEPDPGRLIAWNESGDNLINKQAGDIGMVGIPLSIGEGGTGGRDIEEALSNLGFGATGRAMATAQSSLDALALLDAEPADTTILKADIPDILQTVFGDEAQLYSGVDLLTLEVERNHILWTLEAPSFFSDVLLPFDGTYIFHVYPAGYTLNLAESYNNDGKLPLPSTSAEEIRIVVEQYNNRKSILSVQNMEA